MEIFFARKCIIRRINADRLEHLRIFAQAVPLEARLGNLAAIFISCWRVKLPKPPIVFSRRCADKNAVGGKFRRRSFHFLSVEFHGTIIAAPMALDEASV